MEFPACNVAHLWHARPFHLSVRKTKYPESWVPSPPPEPFNFTVTKTFRDSALGCGRLDLDAGHVRRFAMRFFCRESLLVIWGRKVHSTLKVQTQVLADFPPRQLHVCKPFANNR